MTDMEFMEKVIDILEQIAKTLTNKTSDAQLAKRRIELLREAHDSSLEQAGD